MKVKNESEVTQSFLTLRDSIYGAYQAPPSMGFSGLEYWSGAPLLSLNMLSINNKSQVMVRRRGLNLLRDND